RYLGVALKAVEKVVPPNLTHDRLGDGSHSGAAGLLVNHAHFAKGFSRPKVGQVDVLPVECLADFNLPLFDDVGGFAIVVLSDNNFSGRIPAQRNHSASSIGTFSVRLLPDYTPDPRQSLGAPGIGQRKRAMNRTEKGPMIPLAFLVREGGAEFIQLRVHPRVVLSHRRAISAGNHSCFPPRAPNASASITAAQPRLFMLIPNRNRAAVGPEAVVRRATHSLLSPRSYSR